MSGPVHLIDADVFISAKKLVLRFRHLSRILEKQPRPESRNRILLPDVCTRFNVAYRDTFSMLRHLSIRFESLPPN